MKLFYEADRDRYHRTIEIAATNGCSPHFHAQVEILYVTAGTVSVNINGESFKVMEGGICVSGSYDVHSYSLEENGVGTALMLPIEYLRNFSARVKGKSITNHLIYNENMRIAVESLFALYEAEQNHNSLFEEGWVNALLGLLYDALDIRQSNEKGGVETFREVLTYIDSHYDEELSLVRLSKYFGYTPYYFSRLFNSFADISLKKYINSVRCEAASYKLLQGENITDAAFNSGFNSMRSFYRGFNEHFGTSPQRYLRLRTSDYSESRDKFPH